MSEKETRGKLALHWKILIGLVLGAALGLAANRMAARDVVPGVVDPLDTDANGVHDTLDWVVLQVTDPAGRVFLRLIFMIVLPLVFSALTLGAVEIGDVRQLGKLGFQTLWFTLGFSLMAVVLGIFLVDTIRPGEMLPAKQREAILEQYTAGAEQNIARAQQAKPLKDILLDIIPENPLQEAVGALDASSKGNGMLAVMFFALMFGVALAIAGDRAKTLTGCIEGLYEVSMVIIDFAMRLAPYGVALLMFGVTARLGVSIFMPLAGLIATVMGGLAIQLVVVYSVVLWLFGGTRPWRFFAAVSETMLVAFGTSSSNATLPVALQTADEKLHLPKKISRFVLTIGATGNQNGTALYEGVVVLFLAQVFGVDLTLTQQIIVVLMSVLAGVGTAGVPGGSLPLIVVVLQSVGVPGEGIGIILGIDRLLDMSRTVVNVTGDLAIANCVAALQERRRGKETAGAPSEGDDATP
ncbi:dicarboxylate/amino acid:cation symporter [Thermostilla marina]